MIIRRARRFFAIQKIIFKTGSESVTEGDISKILLKQGDYVKEDDQVAIVEGDKGSLDVFSPFTGRIVAQKWKIGDTIKVGETLIEIDTDQVGTKTTQKQETPISNQKEQKQTEKSQIRSEVPIIQTHKVKQVIPEPEVLKSSSKVLNQTQTPPVQEKKTLTKASQGERRETREKITPVRKQIINNMKQIQQTTAILTTFQECDLSNFINVKNAYQEIFEKKYGVKLSFMSLFYKATAQALLENNIVNSYIDEEEIVHRNYIDISTEVMTSSGMAVTTISDVQNLSLPEIEIKLADLQLRAQQGRLTLSDLQGGTFAISNEGINESQFSIGILNVNQSAILGIHKVENRPVTKNKQIVARPFMYLSLTYDHRIIDGKDSGTFLKTVKQYIEDPVRLILKV